MSDPYYRVRVTVGALEWITESDDAPDYGLADPLTVSWALPENGQLLPNPDPMEASFKVVVSDVAEVAGADIGAPVTIRVWGWPPGTVDPVYGGAYALLVRFRGRVASMTAKPHKLGMIVTFGAVDYTVDLAETTVGATAWLDEGANPRLDRICTEAGIGLMPNSLPPYSLAARSPSPTDARSALVRLLDQTADNPNEGSGAGHRYVLEPRYVPADADTPEPAQPFTIAQVAKSSGEQGAGLFVVLPSGLYGIDIDPTVSGPAVLRRPRVFPAGLVDFDANWVLLKSDRTDTVVVSTTDDFEDGSKTVTVQTPDAVPVKLTLETDLLRASDAVKVGDFNLSDHDSDRWTADVFELYADRDPALILRPYPMFDDGGINTSAYIATVIDGIPEEQNPTGADFYAGMLAAASFTLANGSYRVRVQLRRTLFSPPAGATGVGLQWQDVTTVGPATWAQLDPRFSWYDYRIVRDPAYA